MSDKRSFTYGELENDLLLSQGATDNLVRDLVNMGCVEANRKDASVLALLNSEHEAFKLALKFWSSHEIYRLLSIEFGFGRNFTKDDFTSIFATITSRSTYGEKTIGVYSARCLEWLLNVGIVSQNLAELKLVDISSHSMSTFDDARIKFRAKGYFLANTSPANVVTALDHLYSSSMTGDDAESKFGRNTLSALSSLGLIRLTEGAVVPVVTASDASAAVRTAALATPTVQIAVNALLDDPSATGLLIGTLVEASLAAIWSHASKLRYGTGLATWARWANGMPAPRSLKRSAQNSGDTKFR